MPHHVLIVPLAFDLAHCAGRVIAGPGTKRACDHAAALAFSCMKNGEIPKFLTTATRAGPEYRGVRMGLVMRNYLSDVAPDVACDFEEAATFNTFGEINAVAEYLDPAYERPGELGRILFVAKEWHEPRVCMIANSVFKKRGIQIPFETETHPLEVGANILLHEKVAYAFNWLRLAFA